MNQSTDPQVKKFVRIAIISFVGLVVLMSAYFIFPKSYIKLLVAPANLSLSIDGGKSSAIKTSQTKFVIAGKHTYTFSRDGFKTESVTLESGNNETKELVFVPVALTDAARSILANEGTESYSIQERYASIKEAEYTATINRNYPILKDLPIVLHSMEIDACKSRKYPDDPTKIALCVKSNDSARVAALVGPILEKKGYNAANYEIIYQ